MPAFFVDTAQFSLDPEKGMYRPLLLVSLALNFASSGFDGFGYHLVNVAIHAVNAGLVWWLARLLIGNSGPAPLMAALLFAVHPVATEPVNYISSRSESLSALFHLLAFTAFIRWCRDGEREWRWVCWSAFGLGLLSKSTAITLIPTVLLFDIWFLRERGRRGLRAILAGGMFRADLLKRHAVLWSLAASYLLTIQMTGFLPRSLEAVPRQLLPQLLTQAKAVVYYLKIFVFPVHLSVEPQFIASQASAALTVVVASLFALALVWVISRGEETEMFALLWGGIVLLPVLVMPLNVLVNEHRLYLTSAGFCIALAVAIARRSTLGGARMVGIGTAVAIAGTLVVERNRAWADDLSLWGSAVNTSPYMPRAHLYFGDAHRQASEVTAEPGLGMGHRRAAAEAYRAALALEPNLALEVRARTSLAVLHYEQGELREAENLLAQVLEKRPGHADALVNLGNVYFRMAREQAISRSEEADLPSEADLLKRAAANYAAAAARYPNRYEAHLNLGATQHGLGHLDAAEESYQVALRLNPRDATVLRNLGLVYLGRGTRLESEARGEQNRAADLERARDYLQRARELAPNRADIGKALAEADVALAVSRGEVSSP